MLPGFFQGILRGCFDGRRGDATYGRSLKDSGNLYTESDGEWWRGCTTIMFRKGGFAAFASSLRFSVFVRI